MTTDTTTDPVIDPATDPATDPAAGPAADPAAHWVAVIDANLAAYGNPDAAARRTLLEQAWAVHGELIDPPIDGTGIDGIDQMMVAVQSQFPGHTFRRSSGVDAHHGVARYSWELVAPDGGVSLVGLDVAETGGDGKLVRVVGFMGPLPAR